MKFLEALLPKVYITLIPTETGTQLYGELRKNAKTLKRFDTQDFEQKGELFEAIKRMKRESALSYVALLESEGEQGLFADDGEEDLSSVETIRLANAFELYLRKDDLYERQQAFKEVGLDLIFSPFSLLYNFYEATLLSNDGLYLLLEERRVFAAIIKEGVILFSEQVIMQEPLQLVEKTEMITVYVEKIQAVIKDFYERKVEETMFIEKLFIADTMGFDIALENKLEEVLFVEAHKQNIDLAHELVLLSEKELV